MVIEWRCVVMRRQEKKVMGFRQVLGRPHLEALKEAHVPNAWMDLVYLAIVEVQLPQAHERRRRVGEGLQRVEAQVEGHEGGEGAQGLWQGPNVVEGEI